MTGALPRVRQGNDKERRPFNYEGPLPWSKKSFNYRKTPGTQPSGASTSLEPQKDVQSGSCPQKIYSHSQFDVLDDNPSHELDPEMIFNKRACHDFLGEKLKAYLVEKNSRENYMLEEHTVKFLDNFIKGMFQNSPSVRTKVMRILNAIQNTIPDDPTKQKAIYDTRERIINLFDEEDYAKKYDLDPPTIKFLETFAYGIANPSYAEIKKAEEFLSVVKVRGMRRALEDLTCRSQIILSLHDRMIINDFLVRLRPDKLTQSEFKKLDSIINMLKRSPGKSTLTSNTIDIQKEAQEKTPSDSLNESDLSSPEIMRSCVEEASCLPTPVIDGLKCSEQLDEKEGTPQAAKKTFQVDKNSAKDKVTTKKQCLDYLSTQDIIPSSAKEHDQPKILEDLNVDLLPISETAESSVESSVSTEPTKATTVLTIMNHPLTRKAYSFSKESFYFHFCPNFLFEVRTLQSVVCKQLPHVNPIFSTIISTIFCREVIPNMVRAFELLKKIEWLLESLIFKNSRKKATDIKEDGLDSCLDWFICRVEAYLYKQNTYQYNSEVLKKRTGVLNLPRFKECVTTVKILFHSFIEPAWDKMKSFALEYIKDCGVSSPDTELSIETKSYGEKSVLIRKLHKLLRSQDKNYATGELVKIFSDLRLSLKEVFGHWPEPRENYSRMSEVVTHRQIDVFQKFICTFLLDRNNIEMMKKLSKFECYVLGTFVTTFNPLERGMEFNSIMVLFKSIYERSGRAWPRHVVESLSTDSKSSEEVLKHPNDKSTEGANDASTSSGPAEDSHSLVGAVEYDLVQPIDKRASQLYDYYQSEFEESSSSPEVSITVLYCAVF